MSRFKTITEESYFRQEFPGLFVTQTDQGFRPVTVTDCLDRLESIQISRQAPAEVSELFEAAKGASAYGFLYWPLFTMASHYAILAVEAALCLKYQETGGKRRTASMGETIRHLKEQRLLPEELDQLFHAARGLRNEFSHPKIAILTGPAFDILARSAQLIDALYG